jgi:hypothetical protein
MKNKKAEILIGNLVFILLNAIFIFVLILFLFKQGEGAIVLEQTYAKQIALLVDSAHPDMLIKIDMEKGYKIAEKNGINFADAVSVHGNVVHVQLNDKSGYSYSFFNDVRLTAYPDKTQEGLYVLAIVKN